MHLGIILEADNLWLDRHFVVEENLPEILPRVARFNGRPRWAFPLPSVAQGSTEVSEDLEAEVLTRLPQYMRSYELASVENTLERIRVYYILDEVGSGIRHSKNPK
mmetsp:Transcript_5186/g.10554  ORF Transcript_5186/g.10554 Transcript_5186/m.10554 type:complete len:106 (+) Transcript_5186:851-1168(+)